MKRFAAYETMGKLFEKVSKDSLELSIIERIWGTLQELIIAIANLFGLADEDIYDVMINRSEEMNHMRYLQIKTSKLNLRNLNYLTLKHVTFNLRQFIGKSNLLY